MWYLLVGAAVIAALSLLFVAVKLSFPIRARHSVDASGIERALSILAASTAGTIAVELRHIAQRREEHAAVQLVTLCAAVLEAGDRVGASTRGEDPGGIAGGYYAERALELVIAAAEAVNRDKRIQAGQDPVPPPGPGEQNA